ncbi:MAG: DUF2934 domain-containing protein [Deltaproteobacteria bacterium]|nr:DUF2934 domain-containing protein [Deltaproteobacteria bacterium]
MATKKTKITTSKPAEKIAAAPAPAAAAAAAAAPAKAPAKVATAAPKAVEKKPAEKPAVSKAEPKPAAVAAAPKAAPAKQAVSRGELDTLIREEAYRLATARNFRNGSPVADWLAAEKQVLGKLASEGVTAAHG